MIFGHTVYRYETVTSTQDIAKDRAVRAEPAGTVVAAAFQTGGRGRRGRSWFAPPGANVCMTVIGPPVALADAWQIALVTGIAVAEGIQEATALAPRLRFPNDILCDGAKLSGVLIETTPHSRRGYITPLIGIGVNVNIPEDVFPEDLRAKSTSLLRVTGTEYSVESVQRLILDRLGIQWGAFEERGFADGTLPRWHVLADTEAGRTFVLSGEPVPCRVLRIAADGMLTLETSSGERRTVLASQVIFGDD